MCYSLSRTRGHTAPRPRPPCYLLRRPPWGAHVKFHHMFLSHFYFPSVARTAEDKSPPRTL